MQASSDLSIVHDPCIYPEPLSLSRDCALDSSYFFLHYHDTIELGYVKEGSGTFLINGRLEPFRAGDVSVVFPGEIHISHSAPQTNSVWTYIALDPLRLLHPWPDAIALCRKASSYGQVLSCGSPAAKSAMRLLREAEESGAESSFMLRGILIEFFVHLIRRGFPPAASTDFSKVAPAVTYLSTHYTTQPSAQYLASLCYLSPTHFRRLFKAAMNTSPHEYLHKMRITAATALLQSSSRTIADISESVGYCSISSFHRHYKKITGKSPGEMRK